jgi:hypothetical protein
MPSFDWKTLKNNTLFQIVAWQVFGQLVSGLTEPLFREISYAENAKVQNAELTPEEAATAVNRGFMPKESGQTVAARAGLNSSRFDVITKLAGNAPGPSELAAALRRGAIPYDAGNAEGVGFIQGIRQGNLANKWAPMMRELAQAWPSPSDALDAYLEGQIPEEEAKDLFQKCGGALQYFDVLYNTRGSAPTPTEAAEMANRGIIPWKGTGAGVCSFEQAFLEGPWRNKWEPYFQKAAQYFPPPRTSTAMVREGSLTDEQATDLLEKQGLTPELAAAYLKGAHKENSSDEKNLARATISKLYTDKLISRDDAKGMLTEIGYSAEDSEFILSVVDMQETERVLSKVLSKIQTLYTSYKISKTAAQDALAQLGVPVAQISSILELYDLEKDANVQHLTASQVRSAYKGDLMTEEEAKTELMGMGYTEFDTWVLLSLTAQKAIGPRPQRI